MPRWRSSSLSSATVGLTRSNQMPALRHSDRRDSTRCVQGTRRGAHRPRASPPSPRAPARSLGRSATRNAAPSDRPTDGPIAASLARSFDGCDNACRGRLAPTAATCVCQICVGGARSQSRTASRLRHWRLRNGRHARDDRRIGGILGVALVLQGSGDSRNTDLAVAAVEVFVGALRRSRRPQSAISFSFSVGVFLASCRTGVGTCLIWWLSGAEMGSKSCPIVTFPPLRMRQRVFPVQRLVPIGKAPVNVGEARVKILPGRLSHSANARSGSSSKPLPCEQKLPLFTGSSDPTAAFLQQLSASVCRGAGQSTGNTGQFSGILLLTRIEAGEWDRASRRGDGIGYGGA